MPQDVETSRIANAATEPDEHEEIEVTLEMVDAGSEVILGELGGRDVFVFVSPQELAKRVYLAMRKMKN